MVKEPFGEGGNRFSRIQRTGEGAWSSSKSAGPVETSSQTEEACAMTSKGQLDIGLRHYRQCLEVHFYVICG